LEKHMTFKISYSYKLREGVSPGESRTKPGGTLEEFRVSVADILAKYGHKPEFKLTASFG
jgi:hypothetical protein